MKFQLSNETAVFNGITLYRIQALKDFGNVKSGDLGGFVQRMENLSQYGDCWIYDDAVVRDFAFVTDNAQVRGEAHVYEHAWVTKEARVFGDAQVYGEAIVTDSARVTGNAKVFDNARIFDDVQVAGNAEVYGESVLLDDCIIF